MSESNEITNIHDIIKQEEDQAHEEESMLSSIMYEMGAESEELPSDSFYRNRQLREIGV